jgi:hypothetical protein
VLDSPGTLFLVQKLWIGPSAPSALFRVIKALRNNPFGPTDAFLPKTPLGNGYLKLQLLCFGGLTGSVQIVQFNAGLYMKKSAIGITA